MVVVDRSLLYRMTTTFTNGHPSKSRCKLYVCVTTCAVLCCVFLIASSGRPPHTTLYPPTLSLSTWCRNGSIKVEWSIKVANHEMSYLMSFNRAHSGQHCQHAEGSEYYVG